MLELGGVGGKDWSNPKRGGGLGLYITGHTSLELLNRQKFIKNQYQCPEYSRPL